MTNSIKILSIDGGGTRGLFPATILQMIEKTTGKKITDLFDVIVGAATGGIIASALAAQMDCDSIKDIYLNKAKFILPKSFLKSIFNPFGLFFPQYDNKNLKELLEIKFGNKTLGGTSKPIFLIPTLKLNPTLDQKEIKGFRPVIYNSSDLRYKDEKLVDIALRTSAAPAKLPIYQGFSEGGNYANDPSLAALFFCISSPSEFNHRTGLGASIDQIKLFSLGCGSDESSYSSDKDIARGNWGKIKWLSRLITPLVVETKMAATQFYLNQLLDSDHYLRINVSYNAEAAPEILRGKKLALDVRDQTQLNAIHQYAIATFDKHKEEIFSFINFTLNAGSQ